jgi:hypothetical protein
MMMPQLVGLAAFTIAVVVPLGTARAVLGAILALLVKGREQQR